MTILLSASPALAGSPGGVAAAPAAPVATTAPVVHKLHLSPVTISRATSLPYHGPVYMRTATGELVPYSPTAATTTTAAQASISPATGGSSAATAPATATTPAVPTGPVARPELLVPGSLARYVDGLAAAPMAAPAAVQAIIWAGNELIGLPYIYGGGHASWIDAGYDCSGTVSFALHGAGLLTAPEDSSEFMAWGSHGVGRWVTVFANPEHAYMTVAGLRLDTSAADDPSNQQGPRWRPLRIGNSGYAVKHPLGL